MKKAGGFRVPPDCLADFVVVDPITFSKYQTRGVATNKNGAQFGTRRWIEECVRRKQLLSPSCVVTRGREDGECKKGKRRSLLHPLIAT
jgi:hypothetical protein